ncbi:MAG: acyl-CoA dehydrogenase family protein [Desulfobacterales bacterium]|jgi:alkylation response protein AidB-like acyl-CoA dehydrogenase
MIDLIKEIMINNPKKFGNPGNGFLMAPDGAAKAYACDVAEMVCNRAMESMGPHGYVREYHVEKYLRDSKIIQLWLGGDSLRDWMWRRAIILFCTIKV